MNFQRMTDLDLAGKRVLIREDLNVPVKNGVITSDARLRAALPTIKAALEKGLVDAVKTSDDYLFQRHTEADLYKIDWIEKHSIAERFGLAAEAAMGRVLMRFYNELENRSLFFR